MKKEILPGDEFDFSMAKNANPVRVRVIKVDDQIVTYYLIEEKRTQFCQLKTFLKSIVK